LRQAAGPVKYGSDTNSLRRANQQSAHQITAIKKTNSSRDRERSVFLAPLMNAPHGCVSGLDMAPETVGVEQRRGQAVSRKPFLGFLKQRRMCCQPKRPCLIVLKRA